MKARSDRLITHPLTGLALGAASFAGALSLVALAARILRSPPLLLLIFILSELILLQLTAGHALPVLRFLGGALTALTAAIVMMGLVYFLLVNSLPFDYRSDVLMTPALLSGWLVFGLVFALFNYRPRALQAFLPVFLFLFGASYLLTGWDRLNFWVEEPLLRLESATAIAPALLVVLALLALALGLSLALANSRDSWRKGPSALDPAPAHEPAPTAVSDGASAKKPSGKPPFIQP